MKHFAMGVVFAVVFGTGYVNAAEWYVDAVNGSNSNDGTSWAAAMQTIQEAVNAASASDTVRVADGTYNIGITITPGYSLNNRVVITKDITVRSENGPGVTIIEGAGPEGLTALRGVYMSAGTLSGFTITNGHTQATGNISFDRSGGGIYCQNNNPMVTNCIFIGNEAHYGGGGMLSGTADNCTFSNNEAAKGGGLFAGTADNCAFIENEATDGGGMHYGTANNCTFSKNEAVEDGGGMRDGTANNCTFSRNLANYGGGGMRDCTANNCTFSSNRTIYSGGGMLYGTANNCIFSENTAGEYGGGMYDGTANNCTFSGNSAHDYNGGGMYNGTAHNCIVWGNTAGDGGGNLSGTTANYTCSPSVTHGSSGNITNNPQFVDATANNYRLLNTSPCINIGSNGYATLSSDIDGNQRIVESTVDMGAYEFIEHLGSSLIHYVSEGNSGAQWPYTNLTTAAATIQVAVNTASASDTVLVDAGTYNSGMTITPGYALNNRVVITKAITVRSMNGPDVTIIKGAGPVGATVVRGVYMSDGTLSGFTIINGHTQDSGDDGYDRSGGGVYCVPYKTTMVTNCTFSGNSAAYYGGGMLTGIANNCTFNGNSAVVGGGMGFGTANNCTFIGNSAESGGGMYIGTANNCTFNRNSAEFGGGMYDSTAYNCTFSGNLVVYIGGGMWGGSAYNCIVWGNIAFSISGDNLYDTTAFYTCSPDVTHGSSGNITNNPQFVNAAGGQYRLQSTSLCIDKGRNGYASLPTDLAGSPRIVDGTVDMGAYESADSDDDGISDGDEQVAGTSLSDPNDYFRIESVNTTGSGTALTWTPSIAGRYYSVWWAPTLDDDFNSMATEIEHPQNSYADTAHPMETKGFYKIKVELK